MQESDLLYMIFKYLTVTVSFLGLAGNVLLFLVYHFTSLNELTISVYFRAIALANLFINFYSIETFFENVVFHSSLVDESRMLCKAFIFGIYIAGPISSWIELFAGIDRFLTILHSRRFKFFKKLGFHVFIVVFLVVYNSAVYSYLIFDLDLTDFVDMDTNSSFTICVVTNENVVQLIDLVNAAVLPFLLMLATSIALVFEIMKSRKKLARVCISKSRKITRARDMKFGITMIGLNVVFFIMNAPKSILTVIDYYSALSSSGNSAFETATKISQFTFLMFFSVSFYIQLTINSLVRKRFFELMKNIFRKIF